MFRTQEKLKCMKCNIIPQQFIVLNCYHLLCHDCLLQRNPFNKQITIICSCGCQTILKDNNMNIMKSPKRREVSEFSLSNQSQKNYYQFEKKKVKTNIQSIDEQTIDQTYNTGKESSIRRKDSSNNLIKQIGCFTKSSLLKTNVKDNIEFNQNVDHEFRTDSILRKQLKYIEIQFNKSISDLKNVFQSKIQQFTKIMKQCQRNIQIMYSELTDKHPKINLFQYSKVRYEPISKQLDKLQNQIFSFKINIPNKHITLLNQVPLQHRRLKTQTYQIQTQVIVHPKKIFHQRSPSFQRYGSTEFICPHVSLTIQKQKFIKKKLKNLDQFM